MPTEAHERDAEIAIKNSYQKVSQKLLTSVYILGHNTAKWVPGKLPKINQAE